MDKALSQIIKKLETITYLSDGRISICSCLKNIAELTSDRLTGSTSSVSSREQEKDSEVDLGV
jgi:hypothetical protein